jgi:CubicO group peptidase (beta-lactamase class C family)
VPARMSRAPGIDAVEMTARLREILNRHPAVGLAVGVIRNGRLEFFHAHGLADVASNTPITEDTIFRIASITKTFTAIAVMQLWEQGLVDLDAPANDYLRAYKLVPAAAGWRPATTRHLLTHTGGLPETVHPWDALLPDWGESVRVGRRPPSLAHFYGGRLRVGAQPGTRFVYGNHGPATLGQLVEDVSGQPLDRYFREHIFEPLGMTDTDLLRSEHVKSRLATGYEFRAGGPKAVAEREMITAGAASIYSSPRDMARYLAALLGGGANEHGSVLRPATLATMYEPHYQPDPRVPGLGLAFFRADLGGHRAVEHQGTLPGFHSQLFLAPDDGVGVMAFTNGSVNPDFWLPAECAGLLAQLLGVVDDAIRTDIPQHPETWRDLCGWYQLSARLTDVRLRSFMGAGVEVFVRRGQLMARLLSPVPALFRGFPLQPDDATDPDIFRIDMSKLGPFSMRVVFGREAGAGVTSANFDLMPISLRKQPDETNPRRWGSGVLVGLAITAAAAAMSVASRHGAAAQRAVPSWRRPA